MKRKATITVCAKTRYTDEQEDKSIQTVGGTVEETASGWRLAYAEPAESGMDKTETLLHILPCRVELTRAGAVRGTLVFTEGETSLSVYETPFGAFDALVRTGLLRTRLGAHGGLVKIVYELELGGAVSAHELSIRVNMEEET